MALKDKICVECEKLQLTLIEKDTEIQKLKLHIQNLTNYLLSMDQAAQNDFQGSEVIEVKSIENTTVEQKFYLSDLFLKSCDTLSTYTVFKSISVQTVNNENLPLSEEKVTKSIEEPPVENPPDYVYDQNYQMYYSLSTGYYYDEKSGLMYEPQSGIYYKYDYDKKEYEKVQTQEDIHNDADKDAKASSYICQSMVDQVNNLNLNDKSAKSETLPSKDKNENTLNCDIIQDIVEEISDAVGNAAVHAVSSENDNISLGCAKDWQPEEGSKLTVSDMVKQVVEEVTNMSDYVYDESYGMYYSPSTGYFYDAVRNLLYDPTNCTYYFYDSSNQTYEFYYQVPPNGTESIQSALVKNDVNKDRITSRRKFWKKKLALSQQSPKSPKSPKSDEDHNSSLDVDEEFSAPEDGEIFSSDEDSDIPISIVKPPIHSPSSKEANADELFPPSIRAIVENSDNLQIGSLILITCSGGIIGRDKANAVYLPDICISKIHANVTFNSDSQIYSIEDLGSQNGTFINDKRLSEPKLKSEPHTLKHGDKLSLGSCKLLLHIHEGHDTCDYCEPGQVLAEIASHTEKTTVFVSKEDKEKLRREELRRMKKKYGLQGVDFEQKKTSVTSKGYEDKAELRRQTVGSDNPYEKTEETSVDVSMPETNKGYQMLKKMGWKEGQTLGTSDSGLVEPIPLRPWTGTAGLGSFVQPSSRTQQDKKAMKWVKAQERYFQLSLPRAASSEDL